MESMVRPKKVNYVSQAPPASPSTPASKIFIAFLVFTLKNRLYIANCQFRSAIIAAIWFVDWLVHILKVENFSGNYSDTRFIAVN